MNIAVVTGASSGMGREFVKQIAEKFQAIEEIWVIARRKERLDELVELVSDVKIKPIVCDVTNKEDIDRYRALLKSEEPSIRVLVNAAGFGIIGHFEELSEDEAIGMCDVNMTALTRIIAVSLPYMNEKRSNIINIASAAAFLPQPSFAVYAATKSYVLSLSTALNHELRDRNITVTAVCPGPVSTEFFDIAETHHQVKLYKKMFKTKPNKVVETALLDAYHNYHISIHGFSMKVLRFLCKILPKNFMIKFID